MQGPIAARTRSRRAPSFSIAAIVASTTPPSAPFQPACAAPITPACGIGQQHRRAVGRHHAQHDARPVGHQRVGLGRAGRGPALARRRSARRSNGSGAAVSRSGSARPNVRGGAAAVLAHVVGLIARAVAAVQRRVEAAADAAAAGEEAMLHAVEVGKRVELGSCRPRRVRKTGRRGASAVAHGQDAEQGAHLVGRRSSAPTPRRSRARWASLARAFRVSARCRMSQPPQEVALADRAEGRRARPPRPGRRSRHGR